MSVDAYKQLVVVSVTLLPCSTINRSEYHLFIGRQNLLGVSITSYYCNI